MVDSWRGPRESGWIRFCWVDTLDIISEIAHHVAEPSQCRLYFLAWCVVLVVQSFSYSSSNSVIVTHILRSVVLLA